MVRQMRPSEAQLSSGGGGRGCSPSPQAADIVEEVGDGAVDGTLLYPKARGEECGERSDESSCAGAFGETESCHRRAAAKRKVVAHHVQRAQREHVQKQRNR